jgi:hypothetical protein
MPYDFVIRWRLGSTNPVDAPSRRPDYMALLGDIQDDIPLELLVTLGARIARVQQIQVSHRRRVLQTPGARLPRGNEKTCDYSEMPRIQVENLRSATTGPGARGPLRSYPRGTEDKENLQRATTGPGVRDPLCSHVLRPQDGGEADHLIKCVMMQIITRTRARQAV